MESENALMTSAVRASPAVQFSPYIQPAAGMLGSGGMQGGGLPDPQVVLREYQSVDELFNVGERATQSATPPIKTREAGGVSLSEKERSAEKKPTCNSLRVRGGGPGGSKHSR